MNQLKLKIMIVDDNPAIHKDFIKVLSTFKADSALHAYEEKIFADLNISNPDEEVRNLPEFVFESASQGEEALKKIKHDLEHGEHYALAFVDVRMPPGLDGIETIERMWKLDKNIQAVICTAYSDYTWEETVKRLGVGDNYLILKKPFDSIAVRQLACALTRKWLLAQDSERNTQRLKHLVAKKTKSLQQSLSILRSTIESSIDGILVIDLSGKVIDYNSILLEQWHIPETLIAARNGNDLYQHILAQVKNKKQCDMQMRKLISMDVDLPSITLNLKNGKTYECSSQRYRLNKEIIGRVWNFHDITQRAKLQNKLEYQASHDFLTGLPNRVALIKYLDELILKAKKYKSNFALLFFDLDRFKLINDSLSHNVGDNLLRLVAKKLSDSARKEDFLARLGGDEFVLVCKYHDQSGLLKIADNMLSNFKKSFIFAKKEINASASVGISTFPKDGKTVGQLLKKADLAMYHAKSQGGKQYQFYNKELREKTDKRFKLENELRSGIKNHEFVIYYQPQYDIKNNQLLAVEALLRWDHPKKGIVLPLDFIPEAEDSGLIVPLGEWVIEECCRQIAAWHKKKILIPRVAINLSTKQLQQFSLPRYVKKMLQKYNVEPTNIEFEITENVIISHKEIISIINSLHDIGVNIVLDDFGTGNSSLSYLKNIRIDRLKIDQSFIHNITHSRPDEVIVEAIITMAKNFNFKILAEGVESLKQVEFLKNKNCDEAQGFLYSKPLPAKELESMLKNIARHN